MTRKKTTTTSGASLQVDDLKRALSSVAPAVPGRSAKPVLANVLLADGTVTGTDLEMRIVAPLAGYDGKPLLLPHARLTAIVAQLRDGETVSLTLDGSVCVVASGHATWRLPVEDANEFPVGGDVDAKPIARLPADQFVSLMNSVKFATDNDSSRFALGGVRIEFKDGMLSLVGTDGRRMCVAQAEIDQATDDAEVTVPRRAVDVVCRLARGAEVVQLQKAGNEFIATVDDATVQARLVEGRFPRWTDVDPKRSIASSHVVVGALLHACRQAAICTSEDSLGVTLAFTKEGLHLTSRSAQAGEASVTCDLVTAGHACVVKLDPRFVVEWLGCGSFDLAETIEVEAESDTTAVVLRAQNSRCVIMPLAKE